MWSSLCKWLDRSVIRGASAGPPYGKGADQAQQALELIGDPDFFCDFASEAPTLRFAGAKEFQFPSPLSTPWPENNIVHGRLFRSGPSWQGRPSVILLHGWNGETGYHYQFPWLARRLARRGVNTALIELPYHAQRKPRTPGALQNFISYDLFRMIEATRQAVADTRALAGWLLAQGSPCVGIMGFSLGAWLSGLVAAHDARIKFAALATPVVELQRAIAELPFCAPIRDSLSEISNSKSQISKRLNLASLRPLTDPQNILFIQSRYDLFAPAETIEELWRCWGQPEIWRVPHGHISVLLALPSMERMVRWLAGKALSLSNVPVCV